MIYPITVEVLNQIFSPHGYVEKFVTFQKSAHVQALIQFQSRQNVIVARNSLQGCNIYEGCCQLDIQFLNLEELQENQEEHICYYYWENCFSILSVEAGNTKSPLSADTFGNNGVDESETSGPETPAKEIVDNANGSALIYLELDNEAEDKKVERDAEREGEPTILATFCSDRGIIIWDPEIKIYFRHHLEDKVVVKEWRMIRPRSAIEYEKKGQAKNHEHDQGLGFVCQQKKEEAGSIQSRRWRRKVPTLEHKNEVKVESLKLIGILLSGLFGTGSRASGKFRAVFASIPTPIIAMLYCLFFTYVGLFVPQYFNEYEAVNGYGPVHTSARWLCSKTANKLINPEAGEILGANMVTSKEPDDGLDSNEEDVVPKVDDVSLVDGVFDGAFGGDGDEDFVIEEGVVVSSSSPVKSIKSFLGGMMVSLIFLEGLEEESCMEAMEVEEKLRK
ncbi:polypyrimidine tract-binding protein homolog 3 [Tanacetum coccineum]|uniref:Polypyrimidine tract-binding protein homolog 3 n=1 Tax=Tanacetum coccineum TaxID=301880 RepID=A0ABQ5I4E0_9ASTR